MQTTDELRQKLLSLRGSDMWRRVAQMAGCHYYTVGKVARGTIRNPSFDLVIRLRNAITAVEQAQ